jgi:hypothetical protein
MEESSLAEGVEMYLGNGLLPFYYLLVALSMLAIYIKFKLDKLVLFFIFIYCEGLFSYIGYEFTSFTRIYKLGFLFFSLYLFLGPIIQYKFSRYKLSYIILLLFLGVLFSLNFYINDQDFLIIFSQFQKKLVPIIFILGFVHYPKIKYEFYIDALLWIIGVQFIFALFKFFIWGFGESLVGSISFNGGGASNILPIIAFFLIWVKKDGFLSYKDWLYLLIVFSVSIIGDKRSIIFIFPIFVILTYVFSRRINPVDFLKVSIICFICVFVAVKINPSLNPENSRWGSFDPSFFSEYLIEYSFGDSKKVNQTDLIQGRGGGSLVLLSKFLHNINLKDSSFYIGDGFSKIDVDYENFDSGKYGLKSKGSSSGFFQTFIAYGFFGVILFLSFGFMLIRFNTNKILKWLLFLFILWDFFFFYYVSVNSYSFSITMIFLSLYSNFSKTKYYISLRHEEWRKNYVLTAGVHK